jgi:hypothetical protein
LGAIQLSFVDEPRLAVEHADGLVAVAMKRLAEMFAAETRSSSATGWSLLVACGCSRQEFLVDFGDDDVVRSTISSRWISAIFESNSSSSISDKP